eukprot:s7787_g4.t1
MSKMVIALLFFRRFMQAPGSPLQGLENQLMAMLAVSVNKSEESGKKYLKALPMRRSQRRILLAKRWIVKLYEREGEATEPYKITETDKAVFFNVNALMWAACRGQIEGILGAPPSNSCAELATKQLLLWMVAKEGSRLHQQPSPYLAVTLDPASSWWSTVTWQSFQREYQIPVTQASPEGVSECYCVATNLELSGGDSIGWGLGVNATSTLASTS